MLSVSTSPDAPESAAEESNPDPLPISAGAAEVVPTSTAASVTVPKPAVAPMVLVGRVSSAPTVLLVGASQIVAQSSTVSETMGAAAIVLKPAASPGSTPQNVPSPDSSTVSGLDSTQEKVGCFCLTHSCLHLENSRS